MTNRSTFTIRDAGTPLLRMHVQAPLSFKEVVDIFRWTISGPFPKTYLPPTANTAPLLSLHWMVAGGLLLRLVPHTRVTGCPRTTATIDGPGVIVGETENREIKIIHSVRCTPLQTHTQHIQVKTCT